MGEGISETRLSSLLLKQSDRLCIMLSSLLLYELHFFLGMEEGKYKVITPFLIPFGSSC